MSLTKQEIQAQLASSFKIAFPGHAIEFLTALIETIASEQGGPQYLKYVATLSQSGTQAPVANVLENTLGGDIVFSRSSAGTYSGTLTAAFPEGKTFILMGNVDITAGAVFANSNDTNVVNIRTYSSDGIGGFSPDDSVLVPPGIPIEIRVYP